MIEEHVIVFSLQNMNSRLPEVDDVHNGKYAFGLFETSVDEHDLIIVTKFIND